MTIRKHTRTYYSDDEQGFEYSFEPVNDEVKIEEVGGICIFPVMSMES